MHREAVGAGDLPGSRVEHLHMPQGAVVLFSMAGVSIRATPPIAIPKARKLLDRAAAHFSTAAREKRVDLWFGVG